MGNEGIKVIADAVNRTSHIIRLDVSSNNITQEGAEYLFESLVDNHSLIDLNISSRDGRYRNRIQSIGVKPLKQVLIYNPYLQILNLGGNVIKNEGVKYICDGILKS